MSTDFQFHKEEYLALRKEVEMVLAEFSQLRVYCVLGIGAVISWAAAQTYSSATLAILAWVVVTAIPILGVLSAYAKSRHLKRIGAYIMEIEEKYIEKDPTETNPKKVPPMGWEKYQVVNGKSERTAADVVFWFILIVFSVTVSIQGMSNARVTISSSEPQAASC